MDLEIRQITDSLKLVRIGLINYFLFDSLLFDCGTTCTALKLIKNLDRSIRCIVVSHAHFDHIAGLEVIKSEFPNAKVFTHERIRGLVKKEKVIETWNNEDREFCDKFGEKANPFNLNFEIENANFLEDLKIIETPGHSPDAISLLNEEEGFMLVADALGYPLSSGKNIPMYFYSFSKYIESIDKIREQADIVCLGHNGAIFSSEYCDVAIEEAFKLRKEIQEGLTEEELFNRIYKEEMSLYPLSTIKAVAKLLVKRSIEE